MNDVANTIERFRKTGLKVTQQRLCIFNLLKNNHDHPSAEEIFNRALETHPSISFTTVYKTLQTLRDLGEIDELTIDPVRVHYDPDTSDHAHTFCTACRKIEDFIPEYPSTFRSMINSKVDGFIVRTTHSYLSGLCEKCSRT